LITEAGKINQLINDCGVRFSPVLREASQKIRLSRLRDLLELERLEHRGQTLSDLAQEVLKGSGGGILATRLQG